jgi:spermidine/putrescine transport system ATP-binding protein
VGAVPSGVATREDESAGAGEPSIRLVGVGKRFGDVQAVSDISLAIRRGEFLSLLGPSGCGKTTILRIIGGFLRQDTGEVWIHGREVSRLPPNKRPVNTVFQRYALFPHKNVAENVGFALELQRVRKEEIRARVAEMLALVRLAGFEERQVQGLSGGQAQRVALARALITRPEVLLLDEPLTALDLKLRKAMQIELRTIHEEVGATFVYVTHDQEEALVMSDRIVVMNEGRVVQDGTPAEIYNEPNSVFASQFIGEANLLSGTVAETDHGGTCVEVDGLRLLGPQAELDAGDGAVVSVRPERVRIGAAGSSTGAENCFRGRIRHVIFLGHSRRYVVEIAPEVLVTAQTGVDESPADAGVGDEVEVRWRKSSSRVLPAS